VNGEFVRVAETAMGELDNGIEKLEAASSDVSPDIQAALNEQIEVLQEQQQAASQTLDQLRGASGEMQPYLQAHFISAWNEIVTSYEAVNLLLILDAMCTGCVSA
jgi:ABC-type transporter Mla subunit MlaD